MAAEQWELQFESGDEGLTHLPGWQKFRAWVDTYGGNKIMQYVFKFSAPYAARYSRVHRQVSFSLVWERVRDHVQAIREDAGRRGIALRKYHGFTLNNDFRSYAMRHVMERRPEWRGLFRAREQGTNRVEQ